MGCCNQNRDPNSNNAASSRQHGPLGNIFVRAMTFPKTGDIIYGHKHNFDHMTFVYKGKVRCIAKSDIGVSTTKLYEAPAFFLIPKDIIHEFIALEPSEAYCIFAHRNENGEVVEEWNENYAASQANEMTRL